MKRFVTLVLAAACGSQGDPALPESAMVPSSSSGAVFPPASDGGGAPVPVLARVAPPFDVTDPLAAWPLVIPGLQSRAVTSFDRGGGNDDGFGGTYSEIAETEGEHVIFDEVGPGVLRTLWFTSRVDGDSALGLGRIRFYLDDAKTPAIDVDSDALFAGATPPFVKELVDANHVSSGGFVSWVPIVYRGRLRITTEQRAGFYAAHFDTLPVDWDVKSWAAGDVPKAWIARFSAGPSAVELAPFALDATLPDAGVIDVLRFVPDADLTDAVAESARIRIAFDGATTPQIDVPLGLFFGSGRGVAAIESSPWTMRPRLLESRLPMPFAKGAHVQITGIAGQLSLHRNPPIANAGTLEVHERPLSTAAAGEDVVYADVTGAGKLVATVLAVDPEKPSTKAWWEGDERVRVDGARTPVIHGTGHEDDHLGGWSNEFLSRPFTRAMHGCPRTDLLDTGAEFQKNGGTTMYRVWPGIGFNGALRQTTEHGPGNGVTTRYRAAAFLYRQAPRLVRSSAFEPTTGEARELESAFEGESSLAFEAMVRDTTAPFEFDLAIEPANEGVMLRRLSDRAESPASARLEVDAVPVTLVETKGPYAESRRWQERDVFLPSSLTKGKSSLHVRWATQTKSSTSRFEAWSVR